MKFKNLLFTTLFSCAGLTMSAQWILQAPMTNARGQHGAVAHSNGKVYVWGGFITANVFADLEIYDQASDTWSTGAPIPTATRGMAFELGNDGMVYSFGGFDAGYLNTCYKYNVSTNIWTALTNMPTAVWEGTAAKAPNGNIIVFGGENGMNLVQIYDPVANSWSSGTPIPVASRMHAAITASNGQIYLLGGFNGSTAIPNTQIYNPVTDTWSTGANMPIPRNQFGYALGTDGKMYTIGGKNGCCNNNGPFYADVEVYDPVTDSWATGTTLPIQNGETEAVTINGGINLLAGTGGTYLTSNYRMMILLGSAESGLAGFMVYPNPAPDKVFVSFSMPISADAGVSICNLSGQVIYSSWHKGVCGHQELEIDISAFSAGVYQIRVTSGDDSIYSKLVVQ